MKKIISIFLMLVVGVNSNSAQQPKNKKIGQENVK